MGGILKYRFCSEFVHGDDGEAENLTAESVKSAALSLQSVDDIHGGDGFPAGVLAVGDGITDDVLKEDLQDASGLLVDQARDTLDTATTSETANGGLGDALNVVAQNLAMALCSALAQTLASLSATRHNCFLSVVETMDSVQKVRGLYTVPNSIEPARAGNIWVATNTR